MRIPSGKTDQLIFFVAVDSVDLVTRETGLTTFTVYRSRNGGAATVYTTPTVAELSAANMPGVYSLAIDEDTTIASGSDSEEYCVHITQASMAPVTRTIELYRRDTTTGRTIVVDSAGLADATAVKVGPTGAGTAQTARDIGASVLLSSGTGTGQVKLASGYVAPNWGDVGNPTTAVNLSSTNIDTDQVVASVSGAVGSVTGAVGSVTGAVGSVTGAVGSVTGNVGGNVVGSVASVAAITTSGGIASADVKKINATTVTGTGIASDLWRG